MSLNDNVATALNEVIGKIENDDYNGAINILNSFISGNNNEIDTRLIAEYKLIEKLIEYKKEQQEWNYLRLTKLVYEYCEKRYATDQKVVETQYDLPDKDVIWCCWLQGIEEAPDIVKLCVKSLEKLGKEVRIITEQNMSEYIEMPEYILEKWKVGAMTNTHFSDLLRIELLAERGGLWIDATVFCSDAEEILDILKGTDLFAYSFPMRIDPTKHILFDSWFLYAAKKNVIIDETRAMLRAYWMNEEDLKHYYLFHLCFSSCCRRHLDDWIKIPVFSMEPCHILQQEMLGEYDEKRWEQLMGMSGIHKLSYKYDQSFDIRGTMLEHLFDVG